MYDQTKVVVASWNEFTFIEDTVGNAMSSSERL